MSTKQVHLPDPATHLPHRAGGKQHTLIYTPSSTFHSCQTRHHPLHVPASSPTTHTTHQQQHTRSPHGLHTVQTTNSVSLLSQPASQPQQTHFSSPQPPPPAEKKSPTKNGCCTTSHTQHQQHH